MTKPIPTISKSDDTTVYVPSSFEDGSNYVVDLLDFKGNGSCTCKDFKCRHLTNFRAGYFSSGGCKHIKIAKIAFAEHKIKKLLS